MDYIRPTADGQLKMEQYTENLFIPSRLYGFHNTNTVCVPASSGRTVTLFQGELSVSEEERKCSCCGVKMHKNGQPMIKLWHLPIGGNLSRIELPHFQFFCPECKGTKTQFIPFRAENHRITIELENYVRDLLAQGTFTNKDISFLTGLNENIVKEIDKTRLQEKYTVGGTRLIQPERQARFLGIDEFKLHNNRKYATHIVDLETGHILWIQNGKKKQVVYDFIEHVGLDWMDGVEAVACDMNSDFQEAFEEKCPHIQPVFDYFHIVKNFNDKVVSAVRKDEQRRLYEEGDEEAARALKRTRYILMSKRSTLQRKDEEAAKGQVIHKGSPLFKTEDVTRKGGQEAKYDALLAENKLLFTLDLIKEELTAAYAMTDEAEMANAITGIIDVCNATKNNHLQWFGWLLYNHFEGIIAHATYKISTGKVEGINQKIKTLRRHGYGYPDDEYFFLKLMDISRKKYVRNTPSHRI